MNQNQRIMLTMAVSHAYVNPDFPWSEVGNNAVDIHDAKGLLFDDLISMNYDDVHRRWLMKPTERVIEKVTQALYEVEYES